MTIEEKAKHIWDMELQIREVKDKETKKKIEDRMKKFIFSCSENELYEIDEYIMKYCQADS